MQFLPYTGDGIHWSDSIPEHEYGVVSGIRQNAIQPEKAAELHVCNARACTPLQRPARRLRGWKFWGHARQRLPLAESQRRTSSGSADQSRRNGSAGLGMCCVPAFEGFLSKAI